VQVVPMFDAKGMSLGVSIAFIDSTHLRQKARDLWINRPSRPVRCHVHCNALRDQGMVEGAILLMEEVADAG
jgi:hypothetical protein